MATEDVAERWRAGCECARAVQRLQERENEVAKIIARALACDDYRAQHAEWMADAARWLNDRSAS
jgi:hypothetical protein